MSSKYSILTCKPPQKTLTKQCLDIYLCYNICSLTEIVAPPNIGAGQEVLDEPDTDVVTPEGTRATASERQQIFIKEESEEAKSNLRNVSVK